MPPADCNRTSSHATGVYRVATKVAPTGRVLRASGRRIIPPSSPANSDGLRGLARLRAGLRLFSIASVGILSGALLSLALPQLDYSVATESSRAILASVKENLVKGNLVGVDDEPLKDISSSPRQARVAQAVQRVTVANYVKQGGSSKPSVAPSIENELESLIPSRPKEIHQAGRLAHYVVESPKRVTEPAVAKKHEAARTLSTTIAPVAHTSRALVGRVHSVIKKYAPKHKSPSQLAHAIVHESTRQGVDPLFVAAVIKSESTFNSAARSHKGAQGLMQIMPATGAWLSAKHDLPRGRLTDPGHNLRLGISYLKQLEESYNGNRVFALVAYNWGPGHVDSAAGGKRRIPKECMQYALKIIQDYKRWSSGVI